MQQRLQLDLLQMRPHFKLSAIKQMLLFLGGVTLYLQYFICPYIMLVIPTHLSQLMAVQTLCRDHNQSTTMKQETIIHTDMNGHGEKLINLNKLEVGLGCVVAIIAIAGAVGTWYILPYRVTELEKNQAVLKVQIDAMQKESQNQRELLIRIDERLQLMQKTLERAKP